MRFFNIISIAFIVMIFAGISACTAVEENNGTQEEMEKLKTEMELLKAENENLKETLEEMENMKETDMPADEDLPADNSSDTAGGSTACDFSKDVDLRPGVTFDQFGTEEFETIVCGYFTTLEEQLFGNMQTNAYFVVTEFMDEGFKNNVIEGLDRGNTVNNMIDGNYALNLGCYKDGRIEGVDFNDPGAVTYLSPDVEDAIINSSESEPMALILSYGFHEGFGCICCNLMHGIELY